MNCMSSTLVHVHEETALRQCINTDQKTVRIFPGSFEVFDARFKFRYVLSSYCFGEHFLVMLFSRAGNPSTRNVLAGPSQRHQTRRASASNFDEEPTELKPLSSKFSLSADPQTWGMNVSPHVPEPDDDFHNPTVRNGKVVESSSTVCISKRGLANVGCLGILVLGLLTLFIVYPILRYMNDRNRSTGTPLGADASGKVPEIPGNFGLIDRDTPQDAYTIKSWRDGKEFQLVFSDEFEQDGRSFYPGDDPYWEANNFHYWNTNDLEWHDPAAVTTQNGSLVITLSKKSTHDVDYQGGFLTTWNKFCFTGGYVAASVQLPGINNVVGLWPAVWLMGNLGRAGYGASLEGLWPYSYDACDIGTVANQTLNGRPESALTTGPAEYKYSLSYLPGQRLSRCTCDGESHPGPKHADGTYVGRSAPEIDIFEAQVSGSVGEVSQSGQWAPFDPSYVWNNNSDNLVITDTTTTSIVSQSAQDCYELGTGCFAIYGFEYKPGYESDGAYMSWINDGKVAWTLNAAGVGAQSEVEISARPIPQEPMYLIANLGMSYNFGVVDTDHLTFPAAMSIDYIRVYQDPDNLNIGCNPADFPTAAYIETYNEAYSNPNLTTWVNDYGQAVPKNSLVDQC
ncbi:glycoside hydrolase family 16 protein [Armillaria luteobubalina]|uniref:Glycoside hydrolase family 16 protein n=1 Tax=Armillaria luteobubalina TaxID=153913 RepID=A0AA39UEE9_9AGAR|nr:glycoside hydrolase family 16 protein [Armillaria luteobubalina]